MTPTRRHATLEELQRAIKARVVQLHGFDCECAKVVPDIKPLPPLTHEPNWELVVDPRAYNRYGPQCCSYVLTAAREIGQQMDLA